MNGCPNIRAEITHEQPFENNAPRREFKVVRQTVN
jgi:hypothetical protein